MKNLLSTLRLRFLVPRASAVLRSLDSVIDQLQAAIDKHDAAHYRLLGKAQTYQMKAATENAEAERAHRVASKLRELLG